MFHVSPWVEPNISGQWYAISSPFNKDFLEDFRENIPGVSRAWVQRCRVWLVRPLSLNVAIYLLGKHFGNADFCLQCEASKVCLYWLSFAEHRPWKVDPPPPPAPSPVSSTAAMSRYLEAEQLLGLTPPFTAKEVKTAFRREAIKVHPDRGGTSEKFLIVRQAADLLLRELGDRL
jgi:hypothetical protein